MSVASSVVHPCGTELASDRIRLHKKKVPVQNREAARSIAHRGHTVAHGRRRLALVEAIHRAVEERMNAFEPGDVLLRSRAVPRFGTRSSRRSALLQADHPRSNSATACRQPCGCMISAIKGRSPQLPGGARQ